MKITINEIYLLERFDATTLAKYLRCLFASLLSKSNHLALDVLDQVVRVASESRQVSRPLPVIEVEWLVATAFNHAVDCYASGEEKVCRAWAEKAVELADLVDDGGALARTLRAKFERLQFCAEMA